MGEGTDGATAVADPAAAGMAPAVLAGVARIVRVQAGRERLHPGAALAAYRHGRLVLDVRVGWADAQRGAPVGPGTLFQLRSAGKPLASLALLQLVERGATALDRPVAAHWPAFGRHGKGAVTVEHILSHQGGFADELAGLTWREWGDAGAVARALEELPLVRAPGSAVAYSHLTQQWVCAELVGRIAGRPFPDYLRAEITGPLAMADTHVGLPEGLERRVAMVEVTERSSAAAAVQVRTLNRPAVQRVPAPAFGVATARDMARLYAALAGGGALDGARVLRAETVERALAVDVDAAWDETLGGPVRRGLGFDLGGLYEPDARPTGRDSTARTFWHEGAGTVLCWADRDLGLAVAYLTNGYRAPTLKLRPGTDGRPTVAVARGDTGLRRNRAIADALRAACRIVV